MQKNTAFYFSTPDAPECVIL